MDITNDIARVCHEANRVMQKVLGEGENLPWDWCTEHLQESAVIGVREALAGKTPEQLHDSWCKTKRRQGWTFGPHKDAQTKTHPCLVPYDALPESQRVKDSLFISIVQAVSGAATPHIKREAEKPSDTAPDVSTSGDQKTSA